MTLWRFAKVLPYMDICKVELKLRDSKIVNEKQYCNLLKNELECLRQAVSRLQNYLYQSSSNKFVKP